MNIKAKYEKLLVNGRIHYFFSGIITVIFLAATFLYGYLNHSVIIENERLNTHIKLGLIRTKLESALNTRLLMGQGLVSYLSMKPGLSERDFTEYARRLFSSDPMIRNISVLRGTTIIFAYPIESNRAAIGVDLAKIPQQRDSVLKAINTGLPVVIPRVELIQGGVGTICRIPFFTGDGKQKKYWGQISVVLMQDILFSESGINSADDLNIFMYSINDDGSQGAKLSGNSSIKHHNPVSLDVIFPYGRWRIESIPRKGWGYSDNTTLRYLVFGTSISLLVGALIFLITGARRRIYQLESILPICSSCKKIRNENGAWSPVEQYFNDASKIQFSHSICPECSVRLYGRHELNNKK